MTRVTSSSFNPRARTDANADSFSDVATALQVSVHAFVRTRTWPCPWERCYWRCFNPPALTNTNDALRIELGGSDVSIHAPVRARTHFGPRLALHTSEVSIHASIRRKPHYVFTQMLHHAISIHTPRTDANPPHPKRPRRGRVSIHAPVRTRTQHGNGDRPDTRVSIHAPLPTRTTT